MRRLIICADGTWNSRDKFSDDHETNVALVSKGIPPVDRNGVEQIVGYFEGVGVGNRLDRLTGGAFGSGISVNIKKCYGFVVQNFQPGDELYFFGFSRGAYTVRSVVGLLRNCGIVRRLDSGELSQREHDLIDQAYMFYRERGSKTHPNSPAALEFRERNSYESGVKCLCVWDTVGALGIPTRGFVGWISKRRHAFHDVRLNSRVENAFHALAIDERRRPFTPALWEIRHGDPARLSGKWRVEQRWFAGVHSNVGGGYPDRCLSNISLCWIIDRASSCGLEFTDQFVADTNAHCNCEGIEYDPMNRIYRLLGQYEREIGKPRVDERSGEKVYTNEDIDTTVPQRCTSPKLKPSYRPSNFLKFWSANPDRISGYELPR